MRWYTSASPQAHTHEKKKKDEIVHSIKVCARRRYKNKARNRSVKVQIVAPKEGEREDSSLGVG